MCVSRTTTCQYICFTMGTMIKVVCRDSTLSLLQTNLVVQRMIAMNPGIDLQVNPVSSDTDDLIMDVREHSFTKSISSLVQNGKADIAVHSLKDMDCDLFLNSQAVAILFRDDARDIAVFHPSIEEKLVQGKVIRIGTSSPRRMLMAKAFLEKALPQQTGRINIDIVEIKGNVDDRLQKLKDGEFDGLILATAGINRLLLADIGAGLNDWWLNAKWMLLPLIECVPAPGQGAVVLECNPSNETAKRLLNEMNDEQLSKDCRNEMAITTKYGNSCARQFGVTTIYYRNQPAYFAAGVDGNGNPFEEWTGLPILNAEDKKLFSATDFMKSFFAYTEIELPKEIPASVAFVANYKAVQVKGVSNLLQGKKIWASGTRTWFELAKAGYWVWGSADALGLEFLEPLFRTRLVNIPKDEVCIITHDDAASRWRKKGWKAAGTYGLAPKHNPTIEEQIKEADIVFWTSYNQYELYKRLLKKDVVHTCASGETASLLQAQGLSPVIFPNIKAFTAWRKQAI